VLQRHLQYQKIVLTAHNLLWLDARKMVEDRGGLPSHVLYDHYLTAQDLVARKKIYAWEDMSYCAFHTREILAYPAKGKTFQKGKDLVGRSQDNNGRSWILPASCVPERAFGQDKVSLFIDPEQVEVTNKNVVILAKPDSVVILAPFIQKDGLGAVDEQTRIPLEASDQVLDALFYEKGLRKLHRFDSDDIGPLCRVYRRGLGQCDEIFCGDKNAHNRVAYVDVDGLKYDPELTFADCLELVRCGRISQPDLELLVNMFADSVLLFKSNLQSINPNEVRKFLNCSNLPAQFRFDQAFNIFDFVEDPNDKNSIGNSIVAFAEANPELLNLGMLREVRQRLELEKDLFTLNL
jgi:hypothetical protein